MDVRNHGLPASADNGISSARRALVELGHILDFSRTDAEYRFPESLPARLPASDFMELESRPMAKLGLSKHLQDDWHCLIESRLATLETWLQASKTLAADVCKLQGDVENLKAGDKWSKCQRVTIGERQEEPPVLPVGKGQEENIGIRPLDTTISSLSENTYEKFPEKREYEFHLCVYDAALFMGGGYLPPMVSALTCLSFIVNMVMQLGVVSLIAREFGEEPFPDEEMDRFRYWRAGEGHSYTRADSVSGQSLVSRVCGGDPALAMSGTQKVYNEEIRSYVNFGSGQFLCNISILLWTFCCCVELRMTLELVLAFSILPRTIHGTRITTDNGTIQLETISSGRFLLACFVALCRAAIASLLLYYGSVWLAHTDNISDLLLNASALGFVLDIDETILCLFAPPLLIGILSSIRSIKLPATWLMQFVPLFFLMSISAMLVAMNSIYLQPVIGSMWDVHRVMCSEVSNLDFVFGQNALGWLMYASTPPYSAEIEASHLSEVTLGGIQFLIDKDPEASTFAFDLTQGDASKNLGVMTSEVARSLPDLTSDRQCLDFRPESFGSVRLGKLIHRATGIESLMQAETCDQIQEYCLGNNESLVSQNARFLCPVTCGCADSLSGLWDLAAPDAGCPRERCNDQMQQVLSSDTTCKDMDLEQPNSARWTLMLRRMQELNSCNATVLNNLTSQGCEALTHLDDSLRSSLCGHTNSFLGAGMMCPVACGCMKRHGLFLPMQTAGRFGISCPQSCENLYQCMVLGPEQNIELERTLGMQVNCPERCQDAVLLTGWECPLICDETLSGDLDADYRGCQTRTRSNRTCQMWVSQEPQTHSRSPAQVYPGDKFPGLGYHNYCRNPDGSDTIWCYTTDKEKRWEYCDPL